MKQPARSHSRGFSAGLSRLRTWRCPPWQHRSPIASLAPTRCEAGGSIFIAAFSGGFLFGVVGRDYRAFLTLRSGAGAVDTPLPRIFAPTRQLGGTPAVPVRPPTTVDSSRPATLERSEVARRLQDESDGKERHTGSSPQNVARGSTSTGWRARQSFSPRSAGRPGDTAIRPTMLSRRSRCAVR